MSYPTELNVTDVDLDGDDGQEATYASDGTPRLEIMYSTTSYRLTVKHEVLTYADEVTLIAFYEANKASTFDFTDPTPGGGTYSCKFVRRPKRILLAGGVYRDFDVELTGRLNG